LKSYKLSDWAKLKYWQSGEWQVVEERLHDIPYCPGEHLLFASLSHTPLSNTRVAIIGQDPYPECASCTGVAFEAPDDVPRPASLRNICREYCSDLGYPEPTKNSLRRWIDQGVLLWNAFPSCASGQPGSHHWDEWRYLTSEIITTLDSRGSVVFVFLGGVARSFAHLSTRNRTIETSHPSPMGANKGFIGSRIFSTVNTKLVELKQPTIDWRLP